MPSEQDVRPHRHPVVGILAVRGITKKRLADHLGVNPVFLRNALNGEVPVSPGLRGRISKVLRIPEDKLFHHYPAVKR